MAVSLFDDDDPPEPSKRPERPKKEAAPELPATDRDPVNTSWAAFQSIAPFIPDMDGRILDAIKRAGSAGLTRHELVTVLKSQLCSVCGCVGRLLDAGAIVDSGRRRPGNTGRKIQVLVAANESTLIPTSARATSTSSTPAKQSAAVPLNRYTLAEYAAKLEGDAQ